MAAITPLQMLREASARQDAAKETAKRRSVMAGKVLFWVLVSPLIVATIAALWATYGVR